MSDDFRPWEPDELAIIERLLDEPHPGREEMCAQLPLSRVRPWAECVEHCASLEIEVESTAPRIPQGVPSPSKVEGWIEDSDGVPIEILIFHREGYLQYLEFVVFSERMKTRPVASAIEICRFD